MFIRFEGENLIDDKGIILFIPYDVLREACLTASYTPVSISKIIYKAIQPIAGVRLNMGNCRKSELFNRLESEIRADPRYQEAKNKKMQDEQRRREALYAGRLKSSEAYFSFKRWNKTGKHR